MKNERARALVPYLLGLSTIALAIMAVPALLAQMAPPRHPEVQKHNPFRLYPTGPGGITYDQLAATLPAEIDPETIDAGQGIDAATYHAMTAETRKSVDDIAEWAEANNGFHTAQTWSTYTDRMVQRAKLKEAEYLSGLANIGDVGSEQ